MSKMITGLVFVFVMLTLLAGFIQGESGVDSTILTSDLNSGAASATVQSTGGFLNADTLTIEGEQMTYTSIDFNHFYGLTRGANGTADVQHLAINPDGSPTFVYNQQTSILSRALGFSVNSIGSSSGTFNILSAAAAFFTWTLPNLLTGRTLLVFLPPELSWIGYLWLAVAIGCLISLFIAMIWMLTGLVSKLPGL